MRTIRIALASAVVGALSLAPTQLSPADASASAKASNAVVSTSIGTGTYVVYPTATSSGANPNGTALTLNNSPSAQYFFVRNTGDKAINSFTFSQTHTGTPTFTFKRCSVGVLFSGSVCASGPVATTISEGLVTLSMASGTWVEIQITPSKNTTPTITAQVAATNLTHTPINS